MNYLQYKSDEMYSSTTLIRKSKMVFGKLQNKEIEKAVILRDGKPSFMLLNFDEYEKLMEEFISLKKSHTKKEVNQITLPKNEKEDNKQEIVLEENETKLNPEKKELEEFWD